MSWTIASTYARRHDGAVAKYDVGSPASWWQRHDRFTAWAPDPLQTTFLARWRIRARVAGVAIRSSVPVRFATIEEAMAAADRMWPVTMPEPGRPTDDGGHRWREPLVRDADLDAAISQRYCGGCLLSEHSYLNGVIGPCPMPNAELTILGGRHG